MFRRKRFRPRTPIIVKIAGGCTHKYWGMGSWKRIVVPLADLFGKNGFYGIVIGFGSYFFDELVVDYASVFVDDNDGTCQQSFKWTVGEGYAVFFAEVRGAERRCCFDAVDAFGCAETFSGKGKIHRYAQYSGVGQ